jgi:hypothetical protein
MERVAKKIAEETSGIKSALGCLPASGRATEFDERAAVVPHGRNREAVAESNRVAGPEGEG